MVVEDKVAKSFIKNAAEYVIIQEEENRRGL
ncbi:hypothetical protein BAU18_002670 [Enterococcus diestrammenae]|uniref:Uncharacterized protein n=1 Tax=Enterococcus diestrammenae TaxID=1155073 RepID=A0ABV0F8W4_9ENTE